MKPAPQPTNPSDTPIGPPRDRRRRKRVFTLKNSLRLSLGALVAVLLISYIPDLRSDDTSGFGRLFGRRIRDTKLEPAKKLPVVTESVPIPEQTAADPFLLEPARREQFLGVLPATSTAFDDGNTVGSESAGPESTTGTELPPLLREGDSTQRVSITGGANGLRVETRPSP